MARYRRFRSYAGRARRFGSRAWGRAKGFGISTPWLIGAVAGFMNFLPVPGNIALIAAVAPVKGLGAIKAGAQGYIGGQLIRSMIGGTGSSAASSGSGW